MKPTNLHHVILGGQRSGKSRYAERLARDWLARDARHEVLVVATALAGDEEMRQRIERHRLDRPQGYAVVECADDLGKVLRLQSAVHRMVLVDCLTLWVSQLLMPSDALSEASSSTPARTPWPALRDDLLSALSAANGPVVLVSNEIASGVIPLGPEVRLVVDELGRLHQEVARRCAHVTWMVAGQPFTREVERW